MKEATKPAQKNIPFIEQKTFPGKLPEGVLLQEKLRLANNISSSINEKKRQDLPK